ncbi:MAG: biotin carboxyl carrier protein [Marivirga sp.]|jgi:biotin carboxyl carrier protein
MYKITLDKQEAELTVTYNKEQVAINDKILDWDIIPINKNTFQIIQEAKTYLVHIISIDYEAKIFKLKINGKTASLNLKDKMDILLDQLGLSNLASQQLNDLKAPMPGLIVEMLVEEGQEVTKGDSLLILEAMKMENVIKAAGDGIIKTIKIKKGESVEKGQLLIVF